GVEVPPARGAGVGGVRQGLRQGAGLPQPARQLRPRRPRRGGAGRRRRGRPGLGAGGGRRLPLPAAVALDGGAAERPQSRREGALMSVYVHPTAILEAGVALGDGTSVWDNVHVRRGARLGEECIVGEKTYIAYDVV